MQIHVADVKFVLLHVHNMVKFCGELRGTVGLCEYAIVKRRAVAQGCVSYLIYADQLCNYSLFVCTELLNGV